MNTNKLNGMYLLNIHQGEVHVCYDRLASQIRKHGYRMDGLVDGWIALRLR